MMKAILLKDIKSLTQKDSIKNEMLKLINDGVLKIYEVEMK